MPAPPRLRTRRPVRTGPPPAQIHGAGETHIGHVRDENQDVIVVDSDLGLYVVLDGMSGGNAGDVAARLARDAIVDHVRMRARVRRRWPRPVLECALRFASTNVFEAAKTRPEYRRMGTVVVGCLVVAPTRAVIAHAGDSRAYLLRAGKLARLTRDHIAWIKIVESERLRPNRRRGSPVLTQCLGAHRVHPDIIEVTLKPGDRLLLCSDGLHGYTPARSIRRVLAGEGTPEQIAHRLIDLALRGSAPDNVSAVVIAVEAAAGQATWRSSRARVGTRSDRSLATRR